MDTLASDSDSVLQKQSYQFRKNSQITSSAQLFPEVIKLSPEIAAAVAPDSELAQEQASSFNGKSYLRKPSRPTFDQGQIINMTRYRNILKYQQAKASKSSIVPTNLTAPHEEGSSVGQTKKSSTRRKTKKRNEQRTATGNKSISIASTTETKTDVIQRPGESAQGEAHQHQQVSSADHNNQLLQQNQTTQVSSSTSSRDAKLRMQSKTAGGAATENYSNFTAPASAA